MSLITEFPMGTAIEDQQVSCLWQGKHMLSVSLAGHISYLDPANPSKPLRVIKVHYFKQSIIEWDYSNYFLLIGSQQTDNCHGSEHES
jgi:hypothetical protein